MITTYLRFSFFRFLVRLAAIRRLSRAFLAYHNPPRCVWSPLACRSARLSIDNRLRSDQHYSRGSSRSRNAGRTPNRNGIVYSHWITGDAGYIGTCISNSQDQYTIAHVPVWSVLPLRDVNAPSPRKLARQFQCSPSQWKKTRVSAGDRDALVAFLGPLRSFQINLVAFSIVICLTFNGRKRRRVRAPVGFMDKILLYFISVK